MNKIKLNKAQEEAVLNINGPTRIIAGPGSGKTRTVISKMSYLIKEHNVKPWTILGISFTNKSAREMKERIMEDVGNTQSPVIMTYHGFCAYFLRTVAVELGFSQNYIILDINDSKVILSRISKGISGRALTFSALSTAFTTFKNDPKYLEEAKTTKGELNDIYKTYLLYLEEKKEIGAFDFDDLLYETAKILEENEEIREKWKNKYQYIFVDEFQDTNDVQYDILKYITTPTSNITVVGDPDQNIYSWRGANINIILNFPRHFKGTKDFYLDQNYRSTNQVIKASRHLIEHNTKRLKNNLWTANEEGNPIEVVETQSWVSEAEIIIDKVEALLKEKVNPSEIAIAYRNNKSSAEFEYNLNYRGIPYKLIGGFKFFDRRNVKDTLDYISFLIQQDDYYLEKIINVPKRGFGPKSLESVKYEARMRKSNLWSVLKSIPSNPKVSKFVKVSEKYIEEFKEAKDKMKVIKAYLEAAGLIEYYSTTEGKVEEINEVLRIIGKAANQEDFVTEFIEFKQSVALLSAADEGSEQDKITLITLHSTKGLEFDHVFLVNMNQGIIPSAYSTNIEEERRLAYVGMTRARKNLMISYSVNADEFNNEGPSIFIDEANLIANYTYNLPNKNVDDTPTEIPAGFVKVDEIFIGDMVFHQIFGEGIVVLDEGETIKIAFNSKVGVKMLLKKHPSIYIKR